MEILEKSDLRKFEEVRLVGDNANEIVNIMDARIGLKIMALILC